LAGESLCLAPAPLLRRLALSARRVAGDKLGHAPLEDLVIGCSTSSASDRVRLRGGPAAVFRRELAAL